MLKNKDKQFLKDYCHNNEKNILKFNIGKNLVDDNVLMMLSNALNKYELIKISFLTSISSDKETKNKVLLDLIDKLKIEVVSSIGNVVLIYRYSDESKNHLLKK